MKQENTALFAFLRRAEPQKALSLAQKCWTWEHLCGNKDGVWVFATGGGSENEEIIEALLQNPRVFLCYRLSLVGGFYVFVTTKEADKFVGALREKITSTLWDFVRKK